tara:strand:- start:14047 stop:14985 length:939 start_codon:yes stop_codon:yes gene_type:complete
MIAITGEASDKAVNLMEEYIYKNGFNELPEYRSLFYFPNNHTLDSSLLYAPEDYIIKGNKMACIKADFNGNSLTWDIIDNRWSRYIFTFTVEGDIIQVEPEMNWRSTQTRRDLCKSVWNGSYDKRHRILGKDAKLSIKLTYIVGAISYYEVSGDPYYARAKVSGDYFYLAKHVVGHETYSYEIADKSHNIYKLIKGEEKMNKDTLYEVKETKKMGKYIATNRNGEYVLEMTDGSGYLPFAKDLLEEVIPYTFDVVYNGNGKVYSYEGKEGSVEVGDILINDINSFGIVKAVDTKSREANKAFKGRKITTTAI